MAAPLSRLLDPTSAAFGAASAAAMGALSLVDPGSLSPTGRTVLRTATAAAYGAWTAVTTDDDLPPVSARTLAGTLTGVAAWSFTEATWRFDRRTVRWLSDKGVQHPRRWLAATSAATMLAVHAVDRAAARRRSPHDLGEGSPTPRPLSAGPRAVIRSMLTVRETADSAALLSQLDATAELPWDAEAAAAGHLVPYLELRVTGEVPLLVPHSQVYPVRARFDATDGTPLEVRLHIDEGRLEALSVDVVAHDEHTAEPEEQPWPPADALAFLLDTSSGVVPL